MADDELIIAFRVSDLSLDDEGKVVIRDPQIADLIASKMERQPIVPMAAGSTNNCHGGNCVVGCGSPPTKPK